MGAGSVGFFPLAPPARRLPAARPPPTRPPTRPIWLSDMDMSPSYTDMSLRRRYLSLSRWSWDVGLQHQRHQPYRAAEARLCRARLKAIGVRGQGCFLDMFSRSEGSVGSLYFEGVSLTTVILTPGAKNSFCAKKKNLKIGKISVYIPPLTPDQPPL